MATEVGGLPVATLLTLCPVAGGVCEEDDERIRGEKLKRFDEGESPLAMFVVGEFCCCKTFVLTFGEVEMNLGDVEMTDEGDEAELLVPPAIVSCLKLLLMDLLRQMLRSFEGSLFSLLSLEGVRMKGFVEEPVVVGV